MNDGKFSELFCWIMLVMIFCGAFMVAFSMPTYGDIRFWLYPIGIFLMVSSPIPAIIELETRPRRNRVR